MKFESVSRYVTTVRNRRHHRIGVSRRYSCLSAAALVRHRDQHLIRARDALRGAIHWLVQGLLPSTDGTRSQELTEVPSVVGILLLRNMAHRFFAHAGFLIDGEPGSARAPYREEFMLLDAAAHECSLEVKCRGFTFSRKSRASTSSQSSSGTRLRRFSSA